MKKQTAILSCVLTLSLASTAYAERGYEGGKLSDTQGPDFRIEEPLYSAEQADAEAAIAETKKNAITTQETGASKEAKNTEAKDAAAQDKKNAPAEPQPIVLYGDNVKYYAGTGDFSAEGNVRVLQGGQTLHTVRAEGNMKTGDVFLNQGGRLTDATSDMQGKWGHYNFNSKTGELKEMNGTNGEDFFSADHATIYPEKIALDQGAKTTRCPAVEHDPCLLITAERVEIYPKDRMVAYNVKVFMKGKHIYSRDTWVNRLDGKEKQSVIPRVGMDSDHGLELTYNYKHAFTEKDTLDAELVYYSKIGWRPNFKYTHDEKNFYVSVQNGYHEDSDNNWIKKEREIGVFYKPHKIAKGIPLNYSLFYTHGLWSDDNKTSWHTEYGIYLNHDRINFTKKKDLFLDLGVGAKKMHESYNDYNGDTMLYNARLGKKFDERWSTWLGYYWEKSTNNVFAYESPDMARELQYGLTLDMDKNNKLTGIVRYDEGNRSLYEYILRWQHDFCCWKLELEYVNKRYNNSQEWNVHYDLARW